MAFETTLVDMQRAVGRHIGYNRTYSSMDSTQQADVDDVVKYGLREFYWHKYLGKDETNPHVWSFLQKNDIITTVSDVQAYDLPCNFSLLLSGFTYATG